MILFRIFGVEISVVYMPFFRLFILFNNFVFHPSKLTRLSNGISPPDRCMGVFHPSKLTRLSNLYVNPEYDDIVFHPSKLTRLSNRQYIFQHHHFVFHPSKLTRLSNDLADYLKSNKFFILPNLQDSQTLT